MRVVADTNTIVSGLLWTGSPRHVIDAARRGDLELCTSAALLEELEDVLQRPKLARRLALTGLDRGALLLRYEALATVIEPAVVQPFVLADPDDDAVISCAVTAQADVIVSGDKHLLDLQQYQNIPILTAAELVQRIAGQRQ
jgi:putative PIN family toxin of toxin-antitoxin system